MHYILDWNIKLEYLRLDQIGINTDKIYVGMIWFCKYEYLI